MGFDGPRPGTGNHPDFMVRDTLKVKPPNPHRSDIDVSLLKRILRNAGISVDEWDQAGC